MSEAIDDNKMSDTEALMWRLENDPHLASTFANVTILDRMPDMDRLRRRMERAVQRSTDSSDTGPGAYRISRTSFRWFLARG